MSKFDLGKYWDAFPEALRERYGKDFKAEFDGIKNLYKPVGSGTCRTITSPSRCRSPGTSMSAAKPAPEKRPGSSCF